MFKISHGALLILSASVKGELSPHYDERDYTVAGTRKERSGLPSWLDGFNVGRSRRNIERMGIGPYYRPTSLAGAGHSAQGTRPTRSHGMNVPRSSEGASRSRMKQSKTRCREAWKA